MTSSLHANPALERAVCLANKLITYAIYVAYPCLVAWLFFSDGWPEALLNGDWSTFAAPAGAAASKVPIDGPAALLYALIVPGISFVLVTVLRRAIDAPRPYTVFNTPPVIPKDTRGNSFPSRHAFSIFIIGMTFCACCPVPWAGPVILALGCVLAALRVVGGVHFPRDVIAGAALGIALGWIGFWVM